MGGWARSRRRPWSDRRLRAGGRTGSSMPIRARWHCGSEGMQRRSGPREPLAAAGWEPRSGSFRSRGRTGRPVDSGCCMKGMRRRSAPRSSCRTWTRVRFHARNSGRSIGWTLALVISPVGGDPRFIALPIDHRPSPSGRGRVPLSCPKYLASSQPKTYASSSPRWRICSSSAMRPAKPASRHCPGLAGRRRCYRRGPDRPAPRRTVSRWRTPPQHCGR